MDNHVLVLGIDNVHRADAGFGVRCVEALARNKSFPENVTIMDRGTQDLYEHPIVEESDSLIVLNAVDYGPARGTLNTVESDVVPRFRGAKEMSLRQTGFSDVIATETLMGYRPETLIPIGCQPKELEDNGAELRDMVAGQIKPVVDTALERSAAMGITPGNGVGDQSLPADALILRGTYEDGRPFEDDACLIGDACVLPVGE